VLPVVSGVACLWLMTNLTTLTWLRFLAWLVVGMAIYATYSYRHSTLHHRDPALTR
jgi:APA family basic amino acid/polyamine antiporter